jgi:hypothetical protein
MRALEVPTYSMSDFFGSLRDAVFLETALDDVDGAHASIVTLFRRARQALKGSTAI